MYICSTQSKRKTKKNGLCVYLSLLPVHNHNPKNSRKKLFAWLTDRSGKKVYRIQMHQNYT